jgi:shikimate kinase
MKRQNLTFIGMPGVGKSFFGKTLAEELGYRFLDIDKIIEKQAKLPLYRIIEQQGEKRFLAIEEKVILDIVGNQKISKHIISPGGSVVYSKKAMTVLKKNSIVIYLSASLETILKRIPNLSNRAIVGLKTKNFEEVFKEREPLYQKYADFTIRIFENTTQKDVVVRAKRIIKKAT